MSAPEIEAAALDAIAGETARASRHALPIGAPCPNCATPLTGPWCHACGQKGEEYHRSIWHLLAEAFEGLTHFDSRLWNTVPRLIFRPGKLTHEYLEGHRASQVPPFRMFLIVLLLVFFAGGLAVDQNSTHFKLGDPGAAAALGQGMSPKDKAELDRDLDRMRAELANDPDLAKSAVGKEMAKAMAGRPAGKPVADVQLKASSSKGSVWLKQQLQRAIKNPQPFFFAIEQWGHRFAILMLPIAAFMLTGLFLFRREVYVFDHVIFSMHSLSFLGMLLTAIFLASIVVDWAWWLLWASPVHLFVHMRGTYRTGIFGTLVRMWLLFLGTAIAVTLLGVGLVFVGLAAAR